MFCKLRIRSEIGTRRVFSFEAHFSVLPRDFNWRRWSCTNIMSTSYLHRLYSGKNRTSQWYNAIAKNNDSSETNRKLLFIQRKLVVDSASFLFCVKFCGRCCAPVLIQWAVSENNAERLSCRCRAVCCILLQCIPIISLKRSCSEFFLWLAFSAACTKFECWTLFRRLLSLPL